MKLEDVKNKYRCNKCGKLFYYENIMNTHKLQCEGIELKNGDYECMECGRIFYNSTAIREHECNMEVRIYRCKEWRGSMYLVGKEYLGMRSEYYLILEDEYGKWSSMITCAKNFEEIKD